MAIVFEFDGDVAQQISNYLGDLSYKTPAVIAQAANSTARKARKLIIEDIRKKYTSDAKNKDYNAAMKVTRASAKKTTATIHIKGPVQSLQRFKVDPKTPPKAGGQRPDATRAQVIVAGGTMKMLEKGGIKAFVTQFSSGDIAVVQRSGKRYSYTVRRVRKDGSVYEHTDPKHEAVRKLWTLSVGKMAGSELSIGATMRDEVQEILQDEIRKQIEKLLKKAGRL